MSHEAEIRRANDMLECVRNQRESFANELVMLGAQYKELARDKAKGDERIKELEAQIAELKGGAVLDMPADGAANGTNEAHTLQ